MSDFSRAPSFEAQELSPPGIGEFDLLRSGVINLIERAGPAAISFETEYCRGKLASKQRPVIMYDTHEYAFGLRAIGMYAYSHRGESLYVVLSSHIPDSRGGETAITHEYNMRIDGGEFAEGYHDVYVEPTIEGPPTDGSLSDYGLEQATLGSRILMASFGKNMELAAGDCEIAYENLEQILLQRTLYLP